MDHASVDPPSASRSSDVFGGCEGAERGVASRHKAAELLFLIVGVKRRELDYVNEGFVTNVFQGVQVDLIAGPGRSDLDVADAGTLG
ncbi:hypothetical protein ACF1AU_05590 [Streptomyces rubrogriseus]|uniref:hypothetical protein n=1 Tax=Streptomyces rubrogriseus TaxID=194673 RepID=UPI0037033784